MSDISITPANVQQSASAKLESIITSVAVTAGQVLGRNKPNRAVVLDGADLDIDYIGIAANSAAAGQPVSVIRKDILGCEIGGTVVEGEAYCVSATAGGICPISDLTAGQRVKIIAVGLAGNKLQIQHPDNILESVVASSE